MASVTTGPRSGGRAIPSLAEKFAKDNDAKLYPTLEAYDPAVAMVLGQKRGK